MCFNSRSNLIGKECFYITQLDELLMINIFFIVSNNYVTLNIFDK